MTCRFGKFELDEAARQLRLEGVELPLQPRVFNLLVVLYHHRHRVVSKDELMERLWPGVVVGEGSLQRAVSLARSALKKGGPGGVIRNYPRQGYRLVLRDVESDEEASAVADPLGTARAAFARKDWETALVAFLQSDSESGLDAEDLELLADACQRSGRTLDSEPVLERAVVAASVKGDLPGAARAALRLAEIAFESARIPVAQGWLSRGRHYLESVEVCWEHGFEAYVAARIAVATGDVQGAIEHARRGVEIGRRIGSEDIEAVAGIYLGYGEISLGNFQEGCRLVDEAAATVLSGTVGPRAGGIVYCGLTWLCCNRGDWQRAAEWGKSFERWCEREGMTRFSGLCQLHRAEVLSVTGDVAAAERELEIACDQLSDFSPFASGDAFRILGDLYLVRGDLDRSESAFRRAHELGWEPQPGLARLQAERGESASAIRGLVRALEDRNWALRQRRGLLLAWLVVIASRSGEKQLAAETMVELDAHPELWACDFTAGAVAQARAELEVAAGRVDQGIAAMRDAIGSWQAARAELHQALCRFRLAQLLAMDGDRTGALLELDAAESVFVRSQLDGRVRECDEFRASLNRGRPG